MKWLAARSRAPKLTITIKDPKPNYTTWDRIEGTVTVTTDSKTAFNDIQITFEGSSRVASPRPITELCEATASHTFLKLQQPIDPPISPTYIPGRTYKYPFCFVIPEDLPLGSCIHEKNNDYVDHRHAKLPPTLRFANLSQELCAVRYCIRATVSYQAESNNGKKGSSIICARDIRFVPVHQPNSIPSSLQNFISSQNNAEQQLRSNTPLFSKRLAIASSFAHLVQERYLVDSLGNPFNAYITIPLKFDTLEEIKPPRLRSLHYTLKASTFLATNSNPGELRHRDTAQYRQAHVETIAIGSADISSTQWINHGPTLKVCTKEDKNETGLHYTTSINLPIRIPQNEHLIPSFSTCLISRAYVLDVRISHSVPDSTGGRQTLKTTLPVQVAQPCGEDDTKVRPLWDALSYLPEWIADPPPCYGLESFRSKHVDPTTKRRGRNLSQLPIVS
ncbi:hypothetical protein ASPBRDRAFT_128603 [Aspergillus brasiliensis CBS 101740]|uniref:Arrestin-like N-terminal domain-containing protein n=1 Tax=Aspergillus brasiliensis (strain CBS 101740 / IMI 381727 / IBT 21946) TaxID=767769 RepID=A0A1L9UF79_ASPBC|nr:hypothetical protein ASPBRDRAFT_128603 [Aspergillus brasiliensis CBS 101740]